MDAFISALDHAKADRLGKLASTTDTAAEPQRLLQVALANEISVSELAALWVPTTPEIDVKLAFARQAGDEANHFNLVADRLTALGIEVAAFRAPEPNAMFVHLRGLATTIERIAGGLYALEAIAYAVNETFIAFCAARGDTETVRIYREYIQPDELAHHELGKRLLAKYAVDAADQALAHATASAVFDLAITTRRAAATKLGATCFPGC